MSPVQEHHNQSDYSFMISTQGRRTIRYRRESTRSHPSAPLFSLSCVPVACWPKQVSNILTFMKSQRQIIGRTIKCYTMWRKRKVPGNLAVFNTGDRVESSHVFLNCYNLWTLVVIWATFFNMSWLHWSCEGLPLALKRKKDGKSPAFGRAGFNCFLHVCCCFAFSFDGRLAEASAFNSTAWNHRRSVWNGSGDFSGSQNYSMREHGSHLKQENEKRTKRERA